MRMHHASMLSDSLLVCDSWWGTWTIGMLKRLLSGHRKVAIFYPQASTTTHLRPLWDRTNWRLVMKHVAHRDVSCPCHLGSFRHERRDHGTLASTLYFVLISSANWCIKKVHRRDFILEHAFAWDHSTDRGHGGPDNTTVLCLSIDCLCEIRIIVHS